MPDTASLSMATGDRVAKPTAAGTSARGAGSGSPGKRGAPGKAPRGEANAILLGTQRAHWAGRVADVELTETQESLIAVVLPPKFKASKKAITAVASNARAAAGMRVTGVVEYVDVLRFPDGTLGIGYRPIEGKQLRSLRECVQRSQLDTRSSVAVLRQVLHILASLSEAGILHGALTLDAVVIDDALEVHVADFGLSKLVADQRHDGFDDALRPHTPERVLGLEADLEDAYLWGLLAYRLLGKRDPFAGGSFDDIRRRHAIEDVPPLRAANPDVPPELAAVVERCLVKEPGDRYASMAALERAFVAAQRSAGIRTDFDALSLADEDAEISNAGFLAASDARVAVSAPSPVPPAPSESTVARAKQRADEDEARLHAMVADFDAPPASASAVAAQAAGVAARAELDEERDSVGPGVAAGMSSSAPPPAVAADEDRRRTPIYVGAGVAAVLALGLAVWMLRGPGDDETGAPTEGVAALQANAASGSGRDADARARRDRGERGGGGERSSDADGGSVTESDDAATDATDPVGDTDGDADGDTDGEVNGDTGGIVAEDNLVLGDDDAVVADASDAGDDGEVVADGDGGVGDDGEAGEGGASSSLSADQLVKQAQNADRSGRKGTAISLYRQALSKEPRNRKALSGLGNIYFNRSDYRRAATYFGKAVSAAPNTASYRISLGDAYYKLGRYKDAKKHYAKAKQLGSSSAGRRLEKVNTKLGG